MTTAVGLPHIYLASNEEERLAFGRVVAESLLFPITDEEGWPQRYDETEFILTKVDDEVVGGAILVPFGMWLGGRVVGLAGVHAVAVRPEHRGTGIASELMRFIVQRLDEQDVPLSALYPATQPVYRQAGFEQAGTWLKYRIAISDIRVKDRELSLERVTIDDIDDLTDVYRRWAQSRNGPIERASWSWRRLLERPGRAAFRARRQGVTEGYAVFWQKPRDIPFYDLECDELISLTPAATRRLWSLFSDHSSISRQLVITGSPSFDAALGLREDRFFLDGHMRWMLRIIDVERALTDRGYSPVLNASVTLTVDDELLEKNRDRFTLEVSGGRATVTRGGTTEGVALNVAALAPLYTGALTATQLHQAGRANGSAEDLAKASAIFAGPMPWMPEIF